MVDFFSRTRNIAGLILTISPILAILVQGHGLSFFAVLAAGTAACLLPLSAALRKIPFRLWTCSCGLSALPFFFFSPENPAAPLFLAAACGGILLILPPYVVSGWFPFTKSFTLALIWSASFLLLPLWQYVFSLAEPAYMIPAAVLPAWGLLFLLQKPSSDPSTHVNPLIMGRSAVFLRPGFFTASIGASLGLAASLLFLSLKGLEEGAPAVIFPAAAWLALAISPFLAAFITERKGVFSSCVLLIFLCEVSVISIGILEGTAAACAGSISLMLASGSLPVILPVLAVYLYGQSGYMESCCRLLFFLPLGLLASLPYIHQAMSAQLSPAEPAVLLLILLAASFFCIFFAWKHRFVILKNDRI